MKGPLPAALTLRPGPDGGTEFVLPRWRNGRVVLVLAAFVTLWSAFIGVMVALGVPFIFPLVFGLFDLLLLRFIVHLWAGEVRVTIDQTGVTVHPRLPVLSSTTLLPPGRISDVRVSIAMQSGNALLYNLNLTCPTGATVSVPAFLRNKRDAERVAVLMKQALESTHNHGTVS